MATEPESPAGGVITENSFPHMKINGGSESMPRRRIIPQAALVREKTIFSSNHASSLSSTTSQNYSAKPKPPPNRRKYEINGTEQSREPAVHSNTLRALIYTHHISHTTAHFAPHMDRRPTHDRRPAQACIRRRTRAVDDWRESTATWRWRDEQTRNRYSI